jgi:hypothetical protein
MQISQFYPTSLDDCFDNWVDMLPYSLERRASVGSGESLAVGCKDAALEVGHSIFNYCKSTGETVEQLTEKLDALLYFIPELFYALSPQENNQPVVSPRNFLWRHLDIERSLKELKPRLPFDSKKLKYLFDQYLARPWMSCDYLDWLVLDVSMAEGAIFFDDFAKSKRFGLAYRFAGNDKTKLMFLYSFFFVASFTVSWILPAIFCAWLYKSHELAALLVGGIYYSVNVGYLFWILSIRLYYLATKRNTVLRKLRDAAFFSKLAYQHHLGEMTIYLPALRSAMSNVAIDERLPNLWPPQLLTVLDRIEKKFPSGWSTYLFRPANPIC